MKPEDIEQMKRDREAGTTDPWYLGKLHDHFGYDCMTAGVRAGPATLDGHDYGQKRWAPCNVETRSRMEADARRIARAPDLEAEVLRLRELLTEALPYLDNLGTPDVATVIRAALNGDAP